MIQGRNNRLKASIGIGWIETVNDEFLFGTPDTDLNNVAVTMMATQEMLEEAVRRGSKLIITHEPFFYKHHHRFQHLLSDSVYRAKEACLRTHGLCVFYPLDPVHQSGLDYVDVGMMRLLPGKML